MLTSIHQLCVHEKGTRRTAKWLIWDVLARLFNCRNPTSRFIIAQSFEGGPPCVIYIIAIYLVASCTSELEYPSR